MNLCRSKPQAGKYHNYCNLEKLGLLSALKRKVGIFNSSDLKSESDCVDGKPNRRNNNNNNNNNNSNNNNNNSNNDDDDDNNSNNNNNNDNTNNNDSNNNECNNNVE